MSRVGGGNAAIIDLISADHLRVDAPVARIEVGGHRGDLLHLRRMPDPEQQGFDAAVAPPQHVDRPDLQVVEQRREIVGHLLVGELVGTVGGLPLIAAVHRDHVVAPAEVRDLGAHVGDAAAVAVHQQQRLAGAVDLVVEPHAVVDEGAAGGRIRPISDRRVAVLTGAGFVVVGVAGVGFGSCLSARESGHGECEEP